MHQYTLLAPITKFLHLICGTTFFGLIIAEFFYIARSIHKNDRETINYSIKASYFGDAVILLCAFIQFITATMLVTAGHFTLAVPWIFIAYHAFAVLVLLWLVNLFIKWFYLSNKKITPVTINIFYLLNITMILLFIIIIHDAVTQSTWFNFSFRGE